MKVDGKYLRDNFLIPNIPFIYGYKDWSEECFIIPINDKEAIRIDLNTDETARIILSEVDLSKEFELIDWFETNPVEILKDFLDKNYNK